MQDTSFLEKLSLHARHALKEARDIARYAKSKTIEPRHLLLAVFLENGSLGSFLLENIGFKKEKLGKLCLKRAQTKALPTAFVPLLSPSVSAVLRDAYHLANDRAFPYVGTEHLVSALLTSEEEDIHLLMTSFGIDSAKTVATIDNHLHFGHFPELPHLFDHPDQLINKSSSRRNTPKKKSKTPTLEQFSTDTRDQNTPSVLIGRELEIDRLITILSRRTKNNPLLLGEPGVGKTALVAELALRIAKGQVPPSLIGKRILSLDLALIVAGTNFRGEFESRLKDIVTETQSNPDIILFIDEIHTLVGAGNANGSLDAANILKPALARGEIRCIGATTLSEYKRHIEKDAALERRFQPIVLCEPTPEETLHIVTASAPLYEVYHQVSLSPSMIALIVELASTSLPERFFPDKALDILDEASARASTTSQKRTKHSALLSAAHAKHVAARHMKEQLVREGKFDEAFIWHKEEQQTETRLSALKAARPTPPTPVTEEHIFTAVSRMTGIPLEKLSRQAPEQKLLSLKQTLARELVGQPEVTEVITKALTRSLCGVQHAGRPLASFLLLGPTGVGKTHLAKVLAHEYFENEHSLIRLDMSEFMEKHSVAQMIGAPAGYIGYGEGGKLTERVRRHPSSVVLFDEIEKAHPDVLNILLQILDEGALTDAEGRRVSFKNTLILMTSNIGTAAFTNTASIGFRKHVDPSDLLARFESIRHTVLADLKKSLRPELLARMNEVIVFRPLDATALGAIARLALEELVTRLAKQAIALSYSEDVPGFIADKSLAPEHGARLVRQNLEKLIEYPLAETLIKHRSAKQIALSVRRNTLLCQAL